MNLTDSDIIFNPTNCCDLLTIDILHIVDKDTKFGAANFLEGQRSESIWNTYYGIWARRYVGHPTDIYADEGPQFRSAGFKGCESSLGSNSHYLESKFITLLGFVTDTMHSSEIYTRKLGLSTQTWKNELSLK